MQLLAAIFVGLVSVLGVAFVGTCVILRGMKPGDVP